MRSAMWAIGRYETSRCRRSSSSVDAVAVQLLDGVHDVALVEHHALGRARSCPTCRSGWRGRRGRWRRPARRGRARPSCQQLVGGLDALGQRAVDRFDHEDRARARAARRAPSGTSVEEAGVLDDGDLGAGVAGQVRDLLGRRRVVDADRRGPQELGAPTSSQWKSGRLRIISSTTLTRLDARGGAGRPRRWPRGARSSLNVHSFQVPGRSRRIDRRATTSRCAATVFRNSRGAVCPATASVISSIEAVRHRRSPSVTGARRSLARPQVGLPGPWRYRLDPRVNPLIPQAHKERLHAHRRDRRRHPHPARQAQRPAARTGTPSTSPPRR